MKGSKVRVATACHECRNRKVRCDGARPQCANCMAKGLNCVFPNKYVRANVSEDYVKYLEKRTRMLEHTASVSHDPELDDRQRRSPDVGSSSANSFIRLFKVTVGLNQDDRVSPTIESKSSAVRENLMLIPDVIIDELGMESESPLSSLRVPDPLLLPPRMVADNYIDTYFVHVYPLYPILHRPSFSIMYSALWTQQRSALGYTVVNIMLAIGCVVAKSPDAHLYFERAKPCLEEIALRWTVGGATRATLAQLQVLLLSSIFHLVGQSLTTCGNLLALSNRVTQELYNNKSCDKNSIDKELFSRLYYTAYTLDRFVSFVFGKPFIVTEIPYFSLPSMLDFPMNDNKESKGDLSFFYYNVELSEISTTILRRLYANGFDKSTETPTTLLGVMKTILELEARVTELGDQISSKILNLGAGHESADFEIDRPTITLHIRLLNIKVLLYRSILLAPDFNVDKSGGDSTRNTPLFQMTKRNVSRLCFGAAIELIDFVWLNEDVFLMPSFWYSMLFIYNSAVVVLVAQVTQDSGVDVLTFDETWNKAIALLRIFEKHFQLASQCIYVLENIRDTLLTSPGTFSQYFYDGIP